MKRETMVKRCVTWLCKQIATLGPIGLLPAPGTCGTLAALPLLLAGRNFLDKLSFIPEDVFCFIIFFVLVWVVDKALERFSSADPSSIVIDEVFGFFVAASSFPLTLPWLGLAFVYFRFFDIAKPLGIELAEELPGAWGVMVDDLIAGIYTYIALVITFKLLVFFHVPLTYFL